MGMLDRYTNGMGLNEISAGLRKLGDKSTVTRYLGNCQICEGDFKLDPGTNKTALHGYKRPGHGYVVGDCMGARELPYELDNSVLKKYKVGLETQNKNADKYLKKLEAGEIQELPKPNRTQKLTAPEMVPSTDESFKWILQDTIRNVESNIKLTKREIDRVTKRIDAWEKKDIRSLEEDMAQKRQVSDANKAERAKKRQEKEDKKKALEEKREKAQAKKNEQNQLFIDKFKAIQQSNDSTDDKKRAARDVVREMNKTKYKYTDPGDLDIDDILEELGVAEVTSQNERRKWYRYPSWSYR